MPRSKLGGVLVRSAACPGIAGATLLLGLLLAFPVVAVRGPSEVGPEEELEIVVGAVDAVVEGFVTGVLDTFIVTRREGALRGGHPETWLHVSIVSKLKGPIGIGPGAVIHALVGPEGEDLGWTRQQHHARLFFLRRNDPGRFHPGLVSASVPWVLSNDTRDAETFRQRIARIVHGQSRESLLREADVVVVAHPSGEERRCRAPEKGTCLTLAVDSVLAGRSPRASIITIARGFGIPHVPAIYFLRESASGHFVLAGKTAGLLVPPTFPPEDWYSRNAETIRRQWHRLHGPRSWRAP